MQTCILLKGVKTGGCTPWLAWMGSRACHFAKKWPPTMLNPPVTSYSLLSTLSMHSIPLSAPLSLLIHGNYSLRAVFSSPRRRSSIILRIGRVKQISYHNASSLYIEPLYRALCILSKTKQTPCCSESQWTRINQDPTTAFSAALVRDWWQG